MATFKVTITDKIEAVVEAVDEDDAIEYAREMSPSIVTTYEVSKIKEK